MVAATGSVSAAASVLGSWQICHSVCLALIAALSVIGITLQGMPLLFLTKIAVPVWIVAAALLGLALYFYFAKRCIAKWMLVLNAGLLTAGIPFRAVQPIIVAFWAIGGILVLAALVLLVHSRQQARRCGHGH